MRRRERLGRNAATFAAGGLVFMVGACNLALGLDKYKNCPGPGCAKDATCGDMVQDGDETDTDCGGSGCPACGAGLKCKVDTDCQSGVCVNGTCPTDLCADGVKDNGESDIDCGGPCMRKCADGAICTVSGDCVSGFCSSAGTCNPATCSDAVKNGLETDVDCGGPLGPMQCPRCGYAKMCLVDSDCAGMKCNGTCQGTCNDGVKNQDETDADCGGKTCATRCDDLRGCLVDGDCKSGICQGTSCAPVGVWSVGYGEPRTATSGTVLDSFVAVAPDGNVTAVGDFNGSIDFGSGTFTSPGGSVLEAYIVRLDKTGKYLGSERTSSGGLQVGCAAADKGGNVIFGGTFYNEVDFGGFRVLATGASYAMFLCEIEPVNGQATWCEGFGGTDPPPTPGAIATDSFGNIWVAGGLGGNTNFGTSVSASGPGAFVLKLDPTGKPLWARSYPSTNGGAANVQSMVFDSAGNLLIAGIYAGTLNIGQPFSSASVSDAFVAKLEPTAGAPMWAKGLGGHADNISVAAAPTNDVYLHGHYHGSLNFGGGPLTSAGSAFVAKLTPTGGYSWAKLLDAAIGGLTVDAKGRPSLAGSFVGTVDFGGGMMTSGGPNEADVFLVKLDPSGSYVWGRRFGDSTGQSASGLTLDPSGAAIMNGNFSGQLDFGQAPPKPLVTKQPGYNNMFLAKLNTP